MEESLKTLTDENLWFSTIKETEIERSSTLKIISYLQEIYSRRLHLKRGYSSLHEYCVSVLKYSDGGAYRRVKAMKLVESVPETKKSVEMGSLNLTTASQLQRVIETQEKFNKPFLQTEKLRLFSQVDGKSKREIEKVLAAACPEAVNKTETQRYIAQDKIQKILVISESLNEKIERLKRLRSHENKDFVQILEELVDRELKRVDPRAEGSTPIRQREQLFTPSEDLKIASMTLVVASPAKLNSVSPGPDIKSQDRACDSRYVPAKIKRELWTQYNGQCSYVDPVTKNKCLSTYYLQIDHVVPFAKGGPTILENLRLLCSNHNKLEATRHFGERKVPSSTSRPTE